MILVLMLLYLQVIETTFSSDIDCRKWTPEKQKTEPSLMVFWASGRLVTGFQSDPTDRFGNDLSIFEDWYIRMYPSSRRWSPTYVPVFNFPAADWFPYVGDCLRQD